MVDDTVSEGTRIAQLLSSELTGLRVGPLEHVTVVNADPDAEPEPTGTPAYDVQYREDIVGTVMLHPEHVELQFADDLPLTFPVDAGDDVIDPILVVESGAGVKRAVDDLRTVLTAIDLR